MTWKRLFENKHTKTAEAYYMDKKIKLVNDNDFERAIRRIAKALRNTDVKQITSALAKFDNEKNLIGKCALGVLSCEYYRKITHENNYDVDYNEILRACGVPDEWVNNILPNSCYFTSKDSFYLDEANWCHQLSDMIPSLNDREKLTFDEIAEFLETTFIPERF